MTGNRLSLSARGPSVDSSVVVVACRQHEWLGPCLGSVLDQAGEVIVVDNGSPEGWVAAQARRAGVRVVEMGRNAGFPAGVNAGIAAASGQVIGLLNDDAMAGPGWLARASEVLADPAVGAVAPKLLFASPYAEVLFGDKTTYYRDDPRPLGRMLTAVEVGGTDVLTGLLGGIHRPETAIGDTGPRRWRWTAGNEPVYIPLRDGAGPGDITVNGEPVAVTRVVDIINNAGSYLSVEGHGGDYGFAAPDGPLFDAPADRFAACGAALVARAETFRRLGGFAAAFFAYYEDTDWCWRLQLAGLTVRYDPAATVRHVGGVSTGGGFEPRVHLLAARNRLHTLARNAPLPVLRRQWERTAEPNQPEGLRRALASRLPRGLAERTWLRRHWRRSPSEVFEQWAGVGERWPLSG